MDPAKAEASDNIYRNYGLPAIVFFYLPSPKGDIMVNDPRMRQLAGIEAALRANTGGCQNAHPWIKPLWLEVQRLRKELESATKVEEVPQKTATEILKEKNEANKPKPRASRKSTKTKTKQD